MENLVNRVANSSLITVKPETFFPTTTFAHFDLKDYLFMEMVLKEKEFRAALKAHDWTQYKEHTLLVYCSNDAIIPLWAYMLVATHAAPHAVDVFQGQEAAYELRHALRYIENMDIEAYRDRPVVIKGCAERDVPATVYVALTQRLQPVVRSLMFGEPCSTVPVYKRKR